MISCIALQVGASAALGFDLIAGALVGAVILLIVGLSAWSLFSLKTAHDRLNQEVGFLEAARAGVAGVTPKELLAENKPLEWLLARCKLETQPARDSVIARRIIRMAALSRTRLPGEQILSDLLHRGEDLKPQDARFVASILVFVALVGTVGSLFFSVGGLPSFSSNQTTVPSLAPVIAHVQLAFGVTAAGILGTVLVAVANHLFTRRQDRFLLDVEEFALDELSPLFLAHPQLTGIARLEALQKDMLQATERMATVVNSVGTELRASLDHMREGAEQRAQEFHRAVMEGATRFSAENQSAAQVLKESSGVLMEAVRDAVGSLRPALAAAGMLAEASSQTAQAMENSSGKLETTLHSLGNAIQVLPSHLQTLEAACNRIGQTIETFRNEQVEARNDLQGTLQAWQAVREQLSALKDSMQQTFIQVTQSLQKIESASTTSHREFLDAMRGLKGATQEQVVELGKMQHQLLDGVGSRLDATAEKYQDATLQTWQSISTQMASFTEKAGMALEALQAAAADLQEASAHVNTSINGQHVASATGILQNLPQDIAHSLDSSGVSQDLRQAAQALNQAAQSQQAAGSDALLEEMRRVTALLQQLREESSRKRASRLSWGSRTPKTADVQPLPRTRSWFRRFPFWRP
jgi:hypothetical protein